MQCNSLGIVVYIMANIKTLYVEYKENENDINDTMCIRIP